MKVIDQNSAIASLETALVPYPFLVDGRTEKDCLSFLCDFAALINFYDGTNTVNGTWRPFLLKDPVFLLAHISVTDYRRIHKLYSNTCVTMKSALSTTPLPKNAHVFFNQLFDQITDVFLRIERWTYYMEMSAVDYDLRKYVIAQVKQNFSSLLWAVLALRDQLSADATLGWIEPVRSYVFDAFNNDLWKKYSGRDPYIDVLGLSAPWPTSSPEQKPENEKDAAPVEKNGIDPATMAAETCLTALKNAGDSLFRFFHTIIRHAATEYEKVKDKKSPYPDTTLLRAFVDLMKVHQEELNGIAGKHLHFYYSDILKQSQQPAVADNVFICAVLAQLNGAFNVPAGTLFNAGMDALKNPIYFASAEEVSLNPATVANAYTLSQWASPGSPAPFTCQVNPNPSVMLPDENGIVKGWQTFGGAVTATPVLGFAIGSPMLLLPEGNRVITITMNFVNPIDPAVLSAPNATFALSTKKAWLPVIALVSLPGGTPAGGTPSLVQSVTITITLPIATAPIEAFALPQPDGLQSSMPMMQIMFESSFNLSAPPVIASLNIAVNVTGITTLQLYNDYGLLSTKTPFQIFGPIPGVNSNFIIGSTEIFSKPILSMTLELDWNNIPLPAPMRSFTDYYTAYNNYIGPTGVIVGAAASSAPAAPGTLVQKATTLLEKLEPAAAVVIKAIPWVVKTSIHLVKTAVVGIALGAAKLAKGVWTGVKKIGSGIAGIFKKKSTVSPAPPSTIAVVPPPAIPLPYFNNGSFQVVFNSLQDYLWNEFNAVHVPQAPPSLAVAPAGTTPAATTDSTGAAVAQPLFGIIPNGGALSPSSIFVYIAPLSPDGTSLFPADPTIQDTSPVYTSSAASGFLKMTLTSPSYGFGAPLYAAVVSSVAMQNALKIAGNAKDPVDPKSLLALPNVPFAPQANGVTVSYTASQTYDFTGSGNDYPVQCFYYTPFTNYTVCDNSPGTTFNGAVFNTLVGPSVNSQGLLLFPALPFSVQFPTLPYSGVLFVELANLVAGNYVNLFFELARSYGATDSTNSAEYFYLSSTGWQNLPMINDGTNGFSCSGIIEFNIPAEAPFQSTLRSGPNSWIAVAVTGNPAAYAQTIMLTTNGIELQRSGTAYLSDTSAPQLGAGVISKPQTAIPQIATITQPFPSFGGKAAEDKTQMNQRVSNRIKTKDRTVSREDFFRLIREEFSSIYYSRASFDADANLVTVYVAKQFDSATQPNAFTPLVSQCDEDHILEFLKKRTSLFSSIAVSNFTFCTVVVTATVSAKQGYTSLAVQDNVTQALKVYLSPWITSATPQVAIDQGISEAATAAFISTVEGVLTVSNVSFAFAPPFQQVRPRTGTAPDQLIYASPGMLFVTNDTHNITANTAG